MIQKRSQCCQNSQALAPEKKLVIALTFIIQYVSEPMLLILLHLFLQCGRRG